MENSERVQLLNLATTNIFLRYPKFNLRMGISPYDNSGKIDFETFVKDPKSNLLVYVKYCHQYQQPFEWEVLETIKRRFLDECILHKDNYIFNKDTAIQDPYEINKYE